MKQIVRLCAYMLVCLIFTNCSNTKYLKPGQNLYAGAQVKITQDSSAEINAAKEIRNALIAKTRPSPNLTVLGLRPALFIYNLMGTPQKNKGLRNWIRKKLGEPPVLLSQLNLNYNNAVLKSYLISQGYLQADVKGDTTIDHKRAKAVYLIALGKRYKINQITFPPDTDQLTRLIAGQKQNSLLKTGDYYNLEVFKNERIRIDNHLKENGYFYFNPDYLILQVDSTIGKNLVNVYVNLKRFFPAAANKPYAIGNIKIYPNYSLKRDSVLKRLEPINYKELKIYDDKNIFKPKIWDRLIFFLPGEFYNRKAHNLSLNRLVNINAFQDVRAEFLPADSLKNNQLDLNFYLAPLKKNSLSLSVLGTAKSNNFAGSSLQLSQTFRNIFKGAEQLEINSSGGFEGQYGSGLKTVSSYNFSLGGKLIFPKFIVPFLAPRSTSTFIPKTIISLKYDFLLRDTIYKLSSFKGEYGFSWKENIYKEHNLNPISINYVKPIIGNTGSFENFILNNPSLGNILIRDLIIETNYNFTYNNQIQDTRNNNIFFYGSINVAGNLASLLAKKSYDLDNRRILKKLFDVPVSQFVRFEADFRDYFKVKKNLIWANRLYAGYGIAYGNSLTLPYVKQFSAGGSNDIRAFQARSLGPGSFVAPQKGNILSDQYGDIKLTVSSELRFKIISILHGAIFLDAGNIWLRTEDTCTAEVPGRGKQGSGFKLNKVLNQLAAGTGLGLRVNASVFIIRLDGAFPIRKPFLPEGKRWVTDQINFGSKTWRQQNLIINIGIGYPF